MVLDKFIKKFMNGDASAFDEVYNRTRKSVYYVALSILRDKTLAEDIMQATYIQVYEKISSYQPGTNLRNWILTIAKNLALYELRKRARETLTDDDHLLESLGGYTYDKSLSTPTIELASQILSEEDFKIVMLYAVGEYKHREIADMMHLPLGTVTYKYSMALKKLQKALKSKEVNN